MEGLCNFKEMVRESFTRKKKSIGEFPGGPVVRTRHSQCQGPDSITGWGTKKNNKRLCGVKRSNNLELQLTHKK